MRSRITNGQLRCLAALAAWWQEHGRAPSTRDIGRALGISFEAVHQHLLPLRVAGLARLEYGRHRTLRPTCRFIPASELSR